MSKEMQITRDEFTRRLKALCLRQGGRGLPRKRRDRQILFKSIILLLDADREYTEGELNRALERWLANVGQTADIDHISLRRHLVDEGYLTRDRAGSSYRVNFGQTAGLFDPAVDTLDPVIIIEEARIQTEERKQRYLERSRK